MKKMNGKTTWYLSMLELKLVANRMAVSIMNEMIKNEDRMKENEKFKNKTIGLEKEKEGGARCGVCFKLRLEKTAQIAKQQHFDYFGTTLTVSPHKNSQIINSIGALLEKQFGVKYLYSDFKKKDGYKKSILLSKEYNLYRQDYCGCLFGRNLDD